MSEQSEFEIHSTARFWLWFVVFAILTLCVALIGITYAPGAWYDAIAKPDWTPPDHIFPKVWTTLYVLIAIAGTLVWTRRKSMLATFLWFAQLIANGLWSLLFFGQQRIDAALLDVVILLFLIAGFIWAAWRVSRLAAVLFVPYFAWVAVATALNAHIWLLNGMPMGAYAFPGFE